MDLAFTGFEVVAIVLATIVTRELISDGQYIIHYLRSVQQIVCTEHT
jgi:hypothetical protein